MAHSLPEGQRKFIDTIKQLGNNAVLIHILKDGRRETVFISDEHAAMMEDTPENLMKIFNKPGNSISTTYHEDTSLVEYMYKNHEAPDKSHNLQIRKVTFGNNIKWCNVHYAFMKFDGEDYIYITYSDITLFKNYEEKMRASYDSIGQNFYHQDKFTLGMFRADLTLDVLEEVRGRDTFSTDSSQNVYSEMLRLRARHYINFIERKKFLETFSVDSLLDAYIKGKIGTRQVLLSRRENGNICYVEFSAMMTRNPLTGHVIAFITERECNNSKVYQTIVDKILVRQFEMIAYMAIGKYHVTVSEELSEGSILPKNMHDTFNLYIHEEIVPILHGTDEQINAMAHSLAPDAIAFGTQKNSLYEVNIACEIDGKIFYKQFNFYAVNPGFYIILVSDTTRLHREQQEQNSRRQQCSRQDVLTVQRVNSSLTCLMRFVHLSMQFLA